MRRPLERLLGLRTRLRDAAQLALQQAARAEAAQQEAVEGGIRPTRASVQAAHVLAQADLDREQGRVRLAWLGEQVAQRRSALGDAQRELRQIELLLERERTRQQQRETRRDVAQMEDWMRAQVLEQQP